MLGLSTVPGASLVFVLLVAVIVLSLGVLSIAIFDYRATLAKRAEFYRAIGAEGRQGRWMPWTVAYALSVLLFSMILLLIYVFHPMFPFA